MSKDGVPDFDALHSRTNDHVAVACAFDLLMLNGDDMRRKPLAERKAALGKLLFRSRDGIQYVEHAEGHGDNMFAAVCDLGLEGIVSKSSTRRIGLARPKAGSRSRTRRQRHQREFSMGRSKAECPLLGVKRTCRFAVRTSAFDPKRTRTASSRS